ncbi:MAG: dynein light chain Tctex-type family protein [archaeon]|nr:dynein light chain Tctex-type family protein [archaeon]
MSGKEKVFEDFKDEAQEICENAVKEYFEGQEYDKEKAKEWSSELCKNVIEKLKELNPAYKFMATSIIFPKDTATLNVSGDCYWDTTADGCLKAKLEDNDTILCMLLVHCCKA